MAKQDTYKERTSIPVPLGTHNARIASVIDCGTQAKSNPAWQAKEKLLFGIELVDTNVDFGKGYDEPFLKSLSFNPYLGLIQKTKPSPYKVFLQSLLGRAIEKGEPISRMKLCNMSCKAIFVEKDDDNDPTIKHVSFDRIASVGAAEGKAFAKLRNPMIYFELPEPGGEEENACKYKEPDGQVETLHWTDCFLRLHSWQQKIIVLAPEFIKACAAYKVELIGEGAEASFKKRGSAKVPAQRSATEEAGFDPIAGSPF